MEQNLNVKAQEYDYFVILDFEATCDDGVRLQPQEVIEFPSVLLNARTLEFESEFQQYVKPVHHPKLSKFCNELTGIKQEQVDSGVVFTEALERHQKWLADHGLLDGTKSFIFVTCGDWDLRQMMPPQCKTSGIKVPTAYCKWINIKFPFSDKYNTKPLGMAGMLRRLDLQLQGRHHSGIDDCRNIARIMKYMLQDGVVFKQTSYHTPKDPPAPKPFGGADDGTSKSGSKGAGRRKSTEDTVTPPKQKRGRPPKRKSTDSASSSSPRGSNRKKASTKEDKDDQMAQVESEGIVLEILDKVWSDDYEAYLYQLRWDGTDPNGNPWEPTWEPEENLNCPELLERFERDWEARQQQEEQIKQQNASSPASGESKSKRKSTPPAAPKTEHTPPPSKRLKQMDYDAEPITDHDIPWDHPTIAVAMADHRQNSEGVLEIHHLITWEPQDDDLQKRWVRAPVTRHFAPRAAVDFYEKRVRFEGGAKKQK